MPIIIASVFSFVLTFLAGHGDIRVALFGLRIFFIHFPLIFIIAQVLTRADVERVGRFLIITSIPMAALITMQYFTPQSSWWNRGLGGTLGSGFSGANGFFRPSGAFSFTIGNTQYFSLIASFIFYFWQESKEKIGRLLLIAGTVAALVAIPMSLSRAYVFQVVLTAVFFSVASLRSRRTFGRLFVLIIAGSIVSLLLLQFDFAQTGVNTLLQRFTNASISEGGIGGTLYNRVLGGIGRGITESGANLLWGGGLGLGTNVGSRFLTGSRGFLVAEGEWGRVIGEMGLLLGLTVMIIRVAIGGHFFIKAWSRLRKSNALPWMLISYTLPQIVAGNWGQPTTLGFAIVSCGLLIAAFNSPAQQEA